jgi:2,3,4,5-tetrahydropyridine-2-carboxylate N-succinyltransferase
MMLEQIIDRLYDEHAEAIDRDHALDAVRQLKDLLNTGEVRAAELTAGAWRVNAWVKKGILVAFRVGMMAEAPAPFPFQFFDKDTMAVKKLSAADNVRIVAGGSMIRDGAFVADGVVMMPPSYVNIGAYIDKGTLVDSHALVGSCAQIGRRVHLSAAAQIGGVLEPIGSMPVIIEDNVFVGGNSGIYEGTIVKRNAVIGAGVILTASTPVYDVVRETIYRKSGEHPLSIPEGAVVVPGNRHISQPFAHEHKLSIYAPVIIKYRDERTDAVTALEESLR